MLAWTALSLVAVLGLHAPPPELSDPEAQRHLDEGVERYVAGDYSAAAEALGAAYAIEPNARVLAAWGRAEVKAGNCPAAVEKLRAFLETGPPEQSAAEARALLVQCSDVSEPPPLDSVTDEQPDPTEPRSTDEPATDPAEPVAPPESFVPAEEVPAQLSVSDRARARRWSRDVLGGALVGTGAAALGTGLGLTIAAFTAQARGRTIDDHQEFIDAEVSAQRLEHASLGMYGVGTALVIGGIIRYVLVARTTRRRQLTWGASPNGFVIEGSF